MFTIVSIYGSCVQCDADSVLNVYRVHIAFTEAAFVLYILCSVYDVFNASKVYNVYSIYDGHRVHNFHSLHNVHIAHLVYKGCNLFKV